MYDGFMLEETSELLRNTFIDKEKTRQFIDEAMSREFDSPVARTLTSGFTENERSEHLNDIKRTLRSFALRGLDVIFECAESPIEKIFFNTVNIMAAVRCHFLFFHIPRIVTIDSLDMSAERASRGYTLVDWFIQHHKPNYADFIIWLDNIDDYTDEYKDFLRTLYMERGPIPSRMISLQAEIADIFPYSKFPLRADAFVFSQDAKYKLIVECDGFAYHKEKSSFVRDRQKDRFLRAKGFEILRFSGPEIHSDPIECARQLIEYIYQDLVENTVRYLGGEERDS